MERAVFLDRDGVINRVVERDGRMVSPRTLEDFEIFDFAADAAEVIRTAGFRIYVVTNQPDIARGLMTQATLDVMLEQVRAAIAPDDVVVCPHDDAHQCDCRKPKPGMLTALASKHDVDLSRSFFVGDSWKDIDAGAAAGVPTVLIRREDNRKTRGDYEAEDLLAAAHLIASLARREE
ncbi:MAG: HAD family hydrolase [Deltaproteobacteria bacterium]